MARGEIEGLFEEWRTSGDAEAIADVYAAVELELTRAAKKLVPDAATADDLVQDTWVTALSKAWDFDVRQPLVPWLVGILAMCARRERRRAGRPLDSARLERSDEAPPEKAVANAELAGLVGGALERTPDLYREVLELHLVQGLSHAEIGEKLGRTPGAVRVQVFRGLARLRQLLPTGAALSAAIATLSPSSEASAAARAIDAAGELAPRIVAQAKVGAAAAVGGGGLAWLAKLVAGIAVGLAAVGGGLWLASDARRDASEASALAKLERPSDPGAHGSAPAGLDAPQSSRRSALAPSAQSPASAAALEPGVRLVVELDGADIGLGGTMRVAATPADSLLSSIEGRLAFAHDFELALDPWYVEGGARPRELFLVVDHPRYLATRARVLVPSEIASSVLAPGERREIRATVALEPARAAVVLRALPPAGEARDPRIHAGLFRLRPDGAPEAEPSEALSADPQTPLRLRAREAGSHVVAIVHERSRPATLRVDLHAGQELDLGTVALDAGAAIDGRIVLASGLGVAKARAIATLEGVPPARSMHGQTLTWVDGAFERPDRSADADENGRFALVGLAPRTWRVEASLAPSGHAFIITPDDAPDATSPRGTNVDAPASGVELTLPRINVVLRVTGAGAPLARADVKLELASRWIPMFTDATGLLELVLLADGSAHELRIEKPGFQTRAVVVDPKQLAPGATIDVDLSVGLDPCELAFDTGGDASWLEVWLTPIDEVEQRHAEKLERFEKLDTPGWRVERPGADGTLRQRLSAGRYLMLVASVGVVADPIFALAPQKRWVEIDLPPGGRVVHTVQTQEGGRIRFLPPLYSGGAQELQVQATNERGERVPLWIASSALRTDTRRGRQMREARLIAGGHALAQPIEPGVYVIEATDGLGWSATVRAEISAGRETEITLGAR